MRRTILLMTLSMLLLALPLAAAAIDIFPEIIHLEKGFAPEGITEGIGNTFYYGAINGGAIFRGNYRSGEIDLLVEPDPNRAAAGMSFDTRSNLLYVAGGFAGTAYVYNGYDGTEVANIQLALPFAGLVNDVTVTRDSVYFTDSFQAVIYRLPLGSDGSLPNPPQVEEIPLSGDFVLVSQPPPPTFIANANGIVASPDERWLLIVHTQLGQLYRVDPQTGYATLVDLGGADLLTGDGLVLRGHTLYVVQNFLNQIGVVELDPGFTTGAFVKALTNDAFRFPTTAASFGNALYAVNLRFGEIDPFNVPPDAEFEAVRVETNQ
jgi:sugar lactone lactonase YvrE